MSTTLTAGSTLSTLARQEIRHYLTHKLFWFGAALLVLLDVVMIFHLDEDPSSSASYMIGPGVLLGVLGLVVMVGLTRRSDRLADAAGAVAVPERTRTLALASATVVPFVVALASFVIAVISYHLYPPASFTVPSGVSASFVHAEQFGDGVLCAIGGPLLGLVLARYIGKRGAAALAVVVLVLVTILLQGQLVGGDQPYRVFWVWTYFVTQISAADAGAVHIGTVPGNPYLWLCYLAVLCVLGVVAAVYHDPESDRVSLRRTAIGLLAAALVLGVLTMTVGFTEAIVNPAVCTSC